MSHIKRTWIVENTWVCDSCKVTNPGRAMKCTACGSAKEKQETDIVNPNAAEVTDAQLVALANQGPNWICEFCQGQARDQWGKCKNCAAAKPTEPKSTVEPVARKVEQHLSHLQAPDNYNYNKTTPAFNYGLLAFYTLLVIGGASLLIWALKPTYKDARITDTHWTYTSTLHHRVTLSGSGWGSPSGAFNVSCQNKYYGDEDCHPHDCNPHQESYSCNCTEYECGCHQSCTSSGNGFSSCTEECDECQSCQTCYRTEYDTCYDSRPVYKDYCQYNYYDWPVKDIKSTDGSNGWKVTWPNLSANGPLERLDKSEGYKVEFVDGEGKHYQYSPRNLEEFKYFTAGTTWKLKVILGSASPQYEVQ